MNRPNKIAVTSRSFSRHPVLRQELSDRFPSVTFNDAGESLRGDSLIKFLKGHDAAITALEPIDEAVLNALPELRVISKYGVGVDMVDFDAVRNHDVRFGWTGGVNRRSVAELVICMAVTLLRGIPEANANIRRGIWQQIIGRQLSDATVGIVGCGHVGKEVARLLRAFGSRILIHDICQFPEFCVEYDIEAVTLDKLLQTVDIVTLHLPLDSTTAGIMNAERLGIMKPGAFLINAARGGIVDEATLKILLQSGALGGAGFDVFETEPPIDTELLNLPNFIGTPHIGGSAEEAILAMGRAAIEGLENAFVPDNIGKLKIGASPLTVNDTFSRHEAANTSTKS
jgi:phosphoglycerate dehydrogenase-like enzyme